MSCNMRKILPRGTQWTMVMGLTWLICGCFQDSIKTFAKSEILYYGAQWLLLTRFMGKEKKSSSSSIKKMEQKNFPGK